MKITTIHFDKFNEPTSESFMSRSKGEKIIKNIIEYLDELSNSDADINPDSIRFVANENMLFSFSFLDEIVKHLKNYFSTTNRKIIFEIDSSSESPIYEKLTRISGFRKIDLYFTAKSSITITKIPPVSPVLSTDKYRKRTIN